MIVAHVSIEIVEKNSLNCFNEGYPFRTTRGELRGGVREEEGFGKYFFYIPNFPFAFFCKLSACNVPVYVLMIVGCGHTILASKGY